MRDKLCFLYFWFPSSLSKWKACQISFWEGDTQTVSPQTSPAPHGPTEQSCCCSCMLEMLLLLIVGHISQILPSKRSRALGQVFTTHSSAGLCHQDTVPAQKQLPWTPTGTEQIQTQPLAPSFHSLARSAEEAQRDSLMQSPVPHALSMWMRQAQAKKLPHEIFVTCPGLLWVQYHQRCDQVVTHPPRCGCTVLSKPGVKRLHLLLMHLLILSAWHEGTEVKTSHWFSLVTIHTALRLQLWYHKTRIVKSLQSLFCNSWQSPSVFSPSLITYKIMQATERPECLEDSHTVLKHRASTYMC